MRAVVYREFGPPEVLQLTEFERPTPKKHEVLIRIRATTVTSAECAMRRGEPLWGRVIIGFAKPRKRFRTLGNELAGVVEAVGAGVRRFREGDEVFGFAGWNIGANADYMCLPEKASLAIKPANKTFEESAAAVDGASTALFFLKDKAHLRAGQRVLIVGASGSIGTFAVQLAKLLGAHVTGVCSTTNLDLVRSLGADEVVDYTEEDFARRGETYDVVFDTVGKSSFSHARVALTRHGVFLPTAISVRNVLESLWTPIFGTRRVIGGMSVEKNEALLFLRDLLEGDELRVVIERRYPLEQLVEAHRHVDGGHKKGNVVVTLDA